MPSKPAREDAWGASHASGVSIGGRMALNLWRIMRSETKLTIYTLENVVFEVCKHSDFCVFSFFSCSLPRVRVEKKSI